MTVFRNCDPMIVIRYRHCMSMLWNCDPVVVIRNRHRTFELYNDCRAYRYKVQIVILYQILSADKFKKMW